VFKQKPGEGRVWQRREDPHCDGQTADASLVVDYRLKTSDRLVPGIPCGCIALASSAESIASLPDMASSCEGEHPDSCPRGAALPSIFFFLVACCAVRPRACLSRSLAGLSRTPSPASLQPSEGS